MKSVTVHPASDDHPAAASFSPGPGSSPTPVSKQASGGGWNDTSAIHPYSAEAEEAELRSLQRRLLESKLADRAPKTWRGHLRTICTVKYLKELAPSIVLGIVAIFALTASATAQR